MITAAQQQQIERHAYLPEHIPEYVTAVSAGEPFLFGGYLAYAQPGLLVFVGYPLGEPFAAQRMEEALQEAVQRLTPGRVSLMAPSLPASRAAGVHAPPDHYYRLDLSAFTVSQKLRNMLKRAGRELKVGIAARFTREHGEMVAAFLASRPLDGATRAIFQGIESYVSAAKTAAVFEARTGRGELIAFDVADFKPVEYALYMFNFRSRDRYVPGASDLLLAGVIERAQRLGKRYVNLGLGISPGVAFFKQKWGGSAFLPHTYCLYEPARKGLLEAILRWL